LIVSYLKSKICTEYLHNIPQDLLHDVTEQEDDTSQDIFFQRWPIDWHTDYEAHFDALHASQNDNTADEVSLDPEPIRYIYDSKEMYTTFLKKCMKHCIGIKSYNRFCSTTESLNDYFSIDDEALCVLIIMNSYDKWKDECEWKKDNMTLSSAPSDVSKTFRKTIYTEVQCKYYSFMYSISSICE